MDKVVLQKYELAKAQYAKYGVDTDKVLSTADNVAISLHCWQGDDVIGFEIKDDNSNSGIMTTGNYIGKARTPQELRADLELAMSLIPGKKKVNVHSMYAETNGKAVERNELKLEYFKNWIDWAKANGIGLDFNPSCFNHKNVVDGYTLSSPKKEVREFWIKHVEQCREIAYQIGKATGVKCVNNIWVSDGAKDTVVNKFELRKNLKESLDKIFETKYDKAVMADALESKLFGVGTESFVVGSNEFYVGYGVKNDVMLCLDAGHFHPTEVISDKISAILNFSDEVLLHVSRGVRWDSDHVVTLTDELMDIFREIKRTNAFDRVNVALDYFDASINRIMAWVIGSRNAVKAMLSALLEPTELLMKAENDCDFSSRLALLEEFKALPYHDVFDYYCALSNIPVGTDWIQIVKAHEEKVLSAR